MSHNMLPFRMDAGTFVVFEGLDRTGKSTQLDRLERATYTPEYGTPIFDPAPLFTHQPSGATGLGEQIYALTESIDWRHEPPLSRQFLHLAAHAAHYEHDIIPALRERAVFMDRCWFSAYAYGYRGDIAEQLTEDEWLRIVRLPTQHWFPTLVFLFLNKFDDTEVAALDDHVVRDNYLFLAERFGKQVVQVPKLGRGDTQLFIMEEMFKKGLVNDRDQA